MLAASHGAWVAYRSLNPPPAVPVQVQPFLHWSGALDTGQTVTFAIPLKPGYPRAVIRFQVRDADPYGPVCVADSRLNLAVGQANNPVPAGTVGPRHWVKRIGLAGLPGPTASVHLTVGVVSPGKGNCPVTVQVPSVVLEKS